MLTNKNTPPSQLLQTCGNQVNGGRVIGLDIVRILLVFLIFLFHSRIHLRCDYGLLNTFVNNGHIVAMTAFFMLSGYSLVISNGNKDYNKFDNIKTFYKKRFISIYPLYIIVGNIGVVLKIVMGKQIIMDNVLLIPVELFCFQSFYESLFSYAHNAGTWFISCLLFSYFLFPWFVNLLKNLSRSQLVFALFVVVLLLSYSPYVAERFHTARLYANPFFRLLEFVSGMMIAMINSEKQNSIEWLRRLRSPLAFSLSSLLLFVGITFLGYFHIYLNWLPIICFSIILIGAGYLIFPSSFNNKTVRYLSSISYAFFLGQTFVFVPWRYLLGRYNYTVNNMMLIVCSFIACMFFAVVLHELVENRISSWLKPKLIKSN